MIFAPLVSPSPSPTNSDSPLQHHACRAIDSISEDVLGVRKEVSHAERHEHTYPQEAEQRR